jgi:hypothetical protein
MTRLQFAALGLLVLVLSACGSQRPTGSRVPPSEVLTAVFTQSVQRPASSLQVTTENPSEVERVRREVNQLPFGWRPSKSRIDSLGCPGELGELHILLVFAQRHPGRIVGRVALQPFLSCEPPTLIATHGRVWKTSHAKAVLHAVGQMLEHHMPRLTGVSLAMERFIQGLAYPAGE